MNKLQAKLWILLANLSAHFGFTPGTKDWIETNNICAALVKCIFSDLTPDIKDKLRVDLEPYVDEIHKECIDLLSKEKVCGCNKCFKTELMN